MNYESIIDKIIDAEDGYVDHPDDRGGPTNYGITVATAKAYGYEGDMIDLPLSLAREIYRIRYIVGPSFDKVSDIHPAIGHELVDTGVNMGPARAAEMLQRCLNVFNAKGSRYADVFVDGKIGPVTLGCLKSYLKWRGEVGATVMVKALNVLQGARYFDITEGNDSQESFIYGWIKERV